MQLCKRNDNFTVKTIILLLKRLFFTLIHVVRMIFVPFYHIEIQFNIDNRWAGKVRPVSNCNFLPKSADCLSIIGRPSPGALPMRKVMKKGGSFNETFNLFASTKKSSADQNLIPNRWKHRPTIDRQSPETPTSYFCSPKIGRRSAWVNVYNRIINHIKCTEICSEWIQLALFTFQTAKYAKKFNRLG